jgi:hypothetical protein
MRQRPEFGRRRTIVAVLADAGDLGSEGGVLAGLPHYAY